MEGTRMNDRITCPCCGYRTITGEHDICTACAWHHDSAQEAEPYTDALGPNHFSLKEAQANFATLGASDPRCLPSCEPPGAYARDPAWAPIPPEDSRGR
jgi:hypothetical protein